MEIESEIKEIKDLLQDLNTKLDIIMDVRERGQRIKDPIGGCSQRVF